MWDLVAPPFSKLTLCLSSQQILWSEDIFNWGKGKFKIDVRKCLHRLLKYLHLTPCIQSNFVEGATLWGSPSSPTWQTLQEAVKEHEERELPGHSRSYNHLTATIWMSSSQKHPSSWPKTKINWMLDLEASYARLGTPWGTPDGRMWQVLWT